MIGTNFGIYRPSSAGSGGGGNANQHAGAVHLNDEQRPQGQQLSDFMIQLEDYVPTVPEAVTAHYLNSAGFESNDPRIVRLISVATQKFISDIASDALQHCKTRSNQAAAAGNHGAVKTQPKPVKDRRYTLTMDDLAPALADYGVAVRKAQYFP